MSLFNQLGKTQLGDINTPMKTSHLNGVGEVRK